MDFNRNRLSSAGTGLLRNLNILDAAFFFQNVCINMFANSLDSVETLKCTLAMNCAPSVNCFKDIEILENIISKQKHKIRKLEMQIANSSP